MRKRKAVEKKPLDNLIDRLNVVGEKPSLGFNFQTLKKQCYLINQILINYRMFFRFYKLRKKSCFRFRAIEIKTQ